MRRTGFPGPDTAQLLLCGPGQAHLSPHPLAQGCNHSQASLFGETPRLGGAGHSPNGTGVHLLGCPMLHQGAILGMSHCRGVPYSFMVSRCWGAPHPTGELTLSLKVVSPNSHARLCAKPTDFRNTPISSRTSEVRVSRKWCWWGANPLGSVGGPGSRVAWGLQRQTGGSGGGPTENRGPVGSPTL